MTKEDKDEVEKLLSSVAEKHKEAIKSEVDMAVKAIAVDKDLGERLTKQFGEQLETLGIKADVIKNLQEAIEKQGETMRKFSENQEQKDETVESIVEKHADSIKKLSNLRQGEANLKITIPSKLVNKTQVTRGGVTSTTMAMRLAEVGQLPYLGMKMSELFKHIPVDASANGVIRFYDQQAITRSAAPTAEGASYPESAITWIERLIKVEKVSDSIPVTKEAWKQVYFIQGEIERLLNLNLALKEDQQLYAGTGISPEISGVYTTASAFDGTQAAYAGKVLKANIYDLTASVRVDIMNSKQSKYMPNILVMNPLDILAYKLVKDSFGRYLIPPFVSADGTMIDGMTVIESSQVTANTLLVGDSRYGTIYDDGDITLEMGYINDQMVKGAMTLVADKFETLLIRTVDADGFRKVTDIAAQVGYITAP